MLSRQTEKQRHLVTVLHSSHRCQGHDVCNLSEAIERYLHSKISPFRLTMGVKGCIRDHSKISPSRLTMGVKGCISDHSKIPLLYGWP